MSHVCYICRRQPNACVDFRRLRFSSDADIVRLTNARIIIIIIIIMNLTYHEPLTNSNKLCGRPPQYAPAPCKLTFDLLTLKVVSESRVTWPTSVPILVFLGLSVLDLGPMYATDRQTDVRRASSLNASALLGRGHNKKLYRLQVASFNVG